MALADFYGTWTLDFDYSLESGRFLKMLNEERREQQRGGKVIIDADSIQLINGGSEQPPQPYTIKEATDTETVVNARGMDISIQSAEGDRMRFALTPPGAPVAMDLYFVRG